LLDQLRIVGPLDGQNYVEAAAPGAEVGYEVCSVRLGRGDKATGARVDVAGGLRCAETGKLLGRRNRNRQRRRQLKRAEITTGDSTMVKRPVEGAFEALRYGT